MINQIYIHSCIFNRNTMKSLLLMNFPLTLIPISPISKFKNIIPIWKTKLKMVHCHEKFNK